MMRCTGRPPSTDPFSCRYIWNPLSMSWPLWATVPVMSARNPTRIGLWFWAYTRGLSSARVPAAAAPASARPRASNVLREILPATSITSRASPPRGIPDVLCNASQASRMLLRGRAGLAGPGPGGDRVSHDRPGRAHDAAGGVQDHQHEDRPEDRQPPLGDPADEVLEEDEERRPHERPPEGPRPPEDDHEESVGGSHEAHVRGADEPVVVGVQHAPEPRKGPGDHEGHVLVQPDVVAQDRIRDSLSRIPRRVSPKGDATSRAMAPAASAV